MRKAHASGKYRWKVAAGWPLMFTGYTVIFAGADGASGAQDRDIVDDPR